MSEYASAIVLANKLIAKKGKAVTITRDVAGEFDPVLGQDTAKTFQAVTVQAVVSPVSSRDTAFYAESMTFERLTGLMIAGAGLPFKILPNQTALISSETWTIFEVKPVNYNEGDPIYYSAVAKI